MAYGRAFGLWREQCATEWHAYTRHEFVQGLADGTLPRENFLYYLRQDYVFLIHFSRAWALAVTKADTLAQMQACSATVNALLNGEMQLHIRTCEAAGISREDLEREPEAPENLAYTRFVLEAGYSGDFLDLLAALAPCVLGYGEIGARLAREATSREYGDWIGTYGGADYQQVCADAGGLIDDALVSRLGEDFPEIPRWKALSEKFRTATILEANFWGMAFRPGS